MSVTSKTSQVSPSTGAVNNQLTPNATADNAVQSGTVYIASITIDNSNNAAKSYLKLYDHASPTVGTTAPTHIFEAPASKVIRVNFHKNKPEFTTSLSVACVTAAGTAGTTSPTSTVSVGILTQTADDAT